MYKHKLEKDIRCPLEYGLELFGGKWKSRILCLLSQKETMRYSAVRRDMCNINRRGFGGFAQRAYRGRYGGEKAV